MSRHISILYREAAAIFNEIADATGERASVASSNDVARKMAPSRQVHTFLPSIVEKEAPPPALEPKKRHTRNRTSAKLTRNEVLEVFVADGKNQDIGKLYDIDQSYVSCIKLRKSLAKMTEDLSSFDITEAVKRLASRRLKHDWQNPSSEGGSQ